MHPYRWHLLFLMTELVSFNEPFSQAGNNLHEIRNFHSELVKGEKPDE